MKILIFMSEVRFVHSFGGAEIMACRFANEFAARGNELAIVCNNPESGDPVLPLNSGVRVINLNGTGRKKRYVPPGLELLRGLFWPLRNTGPGQQLDSWRQQLKQKKIAQLLDPVLREEKPDIIISFFNEGLTTLYYCPAADSVPIIQMFHSTPARAIRFKTPILAGMLHRCAAVQVLLPDFISELKEFGNLNPVVIPNPVEQPPVTVEYRETNNGRILCLGRLESGKRQHLLIESFLALAEEFPGWTLHLFGGARKSYLKKLSRQIPDGMSGRRIFFEGATGNPRKEMLTADIFGFPSEFEGFPLALSEAMALGLPAVGFQNAPGVNRLIVDNVNGYLASDANDFTEKIRRLILDVGLRRRLGEEARRSMRQYAPEKVWNAWQVLLQEKSCEQVHKAKTTV